MSSSGWADALLVVTVLAPLAAVVLAVAVALPHHDQHWTTAGCAIAAAGGLVLLASGQRPSVARLAPDDLALAATVSIALLALGARGVTRAPALAAAATVALCGVTAGSPGEPSTVGPLLGIAGAVAVLALSRDVAPFAAAAIAAGSVAAAAGIRSGGPGGAAAVLLGVAAMAAIAGFVPRRAVAVLVPVALVLGLRVAPMVSGTATGRWVAVVVGGAAAVAVVGPVVTPRWRMPAAGCAALALWALVAAVEPMAGTAGAARALGAASVFGLVLGGALSLVAALPGAAALLPAIADGRGWPRPVIGLLVTATIVGLIHTRASDDGARLRVVDVVALGFAGWLVVRPTTWTWARLSDVGAYSDGAVVALASSLIAGALATARTGPFDFATVVPWLVVDDREPAAPRARVAVAALVATVAMGTVTALLVRSARL